MRAIQIFMLVSLFLISCTKVETEGATSETPVIPSSPISDDDLPPGEPSAQPTVENPPAPRVGPQIVTPMSLTPGS